MPSEETLGPVTRDWSLGTCAYTGLTTSTFEALPCYEPIPYGYTYTSPEPTLWDKFMSIIIKLLYIIGVPLRG